MKRELNFQGPSPILYLISTPIGNLSEFPPRALEVLKGVDFVAAEDTRNASKLLSLFDIDKPTISCHEHNEEETSEKIIGLLKEGRKVAYMSDAGYPAISDPGQRLVANCIEAGVKVSVVSGPCAAINALACSGFPTDHFYFHGFLPAKASEMKTELESIAAKTETIIFYESPHRIRKTLAALFQTLGERRAVIGRELTKLHEEFIRGSLGEFTQIDPETLKGEMVLIVEGNHGKPLQIDDETIINALKEELESGSSKKDAVTNVSIKFNEKKNRVYALLLSRF